MSIKSLSKSSRRSLVILAGALAAVALYFGVMALLQRAPRLSFEVVEKGRLLRTAQPRPGDLDRILATQGLGAIFSLRGGEEPEVKQWAKEHGVIYLSTQMWADHPPTDGQIGLFFDIMRGAVIHHDRYQDVITHRTTIGPKDDFVYPFPVLIHCEGGSDRTGVMVALFRMAFQGWGVKLAEQEMSDHLHFTSLHPAQFQFLERIAPVINPYYGSRSLPVPAAPVPLAPPATAPVPSATTAPTPPPTAVSPSPAPPAQAPAGPVPVTPTGTP
jgi:hypothetical protein